MSWINKYGIEVEPPRRAVESTETNEFRATILFWYCMSVAGVPVRDIASCFGIGKSLVHRHIQEIPDDLKDSYKSSDIVGRLRAAFPKGRRPQSYADLRAVLRSVHPA